MAAIAGSPVEKKSRRSIAVILEHASDPSADVLVLGGHAYLPAAITRGAPKMPSIQ